MKNTSIPTALLLLACASAALAAPSASNSSTGNSTGSNATSSKAAGANSAGANATSSKAAGANSAGSSTSASKNVAPEKSSSKSGTVDQATAPKPPAADGKAATAKAGTAKSAAANVGSTKPAVAKAGPATAKTGTTKTSSTLKPSPVTKNASIKVPVKGPSTKAPATVAADGTPIWLDVKSAKLAAKLKNKPILADFYTDWCHWCKVMDRTTYRDSEVLNYLAANYVCMKVDAQDGGDGQELATRFGISGFPTTLVILPTGKPLAVAEGYRDKPAFMKFMNAVAKLPKGK